MNSLENICVDGTNSNEIFNTLNDIGFSKLPRALWGAETHVRSNGLYNDFVFLDGNNTYSITLNRHETEEFDELLKLESSNRAPSPISGVIFGMIAGGLSYAFTRDPEISSYVALGAGILATALTSLNKKLMVDKTKELWENYSDRLKRSNTQFDMRIVNQYLAK
ncbi:hypothetical protein ISS07_01080 [Candidatus Woesearchaeota archaeon]|nr:hypothetical protein [Candidatus Woesearchaeota archaeon]